MDRDLDEEFPIRDWQPSSPELEVSAWRGWRVVIVLFLLGIRPKHVENLVRDPYMTVRQVARYLGVHPETVRRLTREFPQVLHGVNVGGVWRYKKSQIDQDVAQWTQRRRQYYTRARWERSEEKRERRRLKKQGLLEDDEE